MLEVEAKMPSLIFSRDQDINGMTVEQVDQVLWQEFRNGLCLRVLHMQSINLEDEDIE